MTWKAMRTCLAALLALALAPRAHANSDKISIRTLSTHADRVSGGDVLVEVDVPRAPKHGGVVVSLNGRDVTSSFHETAPGTLVGLVRGLSLGDNRLIAEAKGAGNESLRLVNYPITGPIISGPQGKVGPQERPFICQTQSFLLPDGTPYWASPDEDCSAPTKITYVYLPVGGTTFKPLPSTTSLPADVSRTTTLSGVTMPYVVRVETSTINRGIAQVAVLHDPTSESQPTPFAAPKGWNRKLIAVQGFGCPGGWYIQGPAEGNLSLAGVSAQVLDPARLGEGYATFANTLQHPSNNCNALLGGETMMMSKEHFIEEFGVPRATVSVGCSGGSYTSLQYGDTFPGLIDGILIECTFPDAMEIAFSASDGHLLTHYFTRTNPTGFTLAQQIAVSGYKVSNVAGHPEQAWYDAANQAQRTDPDLLSTSTLIRGPDVAGYTGAVWTSAVPASLQYDPFTNPTGARPTVYDVDRNVMGIDWRTGFALRPFDNVGVQYGLAALNAGTITKAQFLDLNGRIGGYDHDTNYVASRVTGDEGAIERMQEAGVTFGGSGGMSEVPVFDVTGIYNDDAGYHYQWHHFAARDRIREVNGGNSDNHVMWRGNPVPGDRAWALLTQWIDAIDADTSGAPQRVKVIRNKPAAAVDGCWPTTSTFIAEPQVFGSAPTTQCNSLFPSFAFPRYVAGEPLKANVYKCHLERIDPADYAVSFTADEMARLRAIFPDGVCDWSKKSVGYRRVVTWPSFGPSPDNQVFDVTNRHHD
jgi:Tannase-like family of unknown function (DUF6351)